MPFQFSVNKTVICRFDNRNPEVISIRGTELLCGYRHLLPKTASRPEIEDALGVQELGRKRSLKNLITLC